jgi:hypothetical protein
MQADATVAPTCIDIIYILHVYLSLCVITIYCKCVSTNAYCLLSIKKKVPEYSICILMVLKHFIKFYSQLT